jgi:hypothetical protein
MGLLFAVGSACFALASMASQWASAPRPGIGVTFFTGSIFFTSAAFIQWRTATERADRDASLVQFAGTLFFNASTYAGMKHGLDTKEADLRVWTPDAIGSVCFLVSSAMAYGQVPGRMAGLNLLGSIAFGVSAVTSLIEPSTDEPVSAAIANAGTTLGALCFLAGAIMVMRGAAPQTTSATPGSRTQLRPDVREPGRVDV